MALASRVDGRRVFALGIAGLVPAALVTLLFFHQPSVGERRLYPMMRGSLALTGLALALAALISWAMAPDRLARSSLSGLAWAGVTAILCIGPFLESSPRARLYAIDLESGEIEWNLPGDGVDPRLYGADLIVTDVAGGHALFLDPEDGDVRQRVSLDGTDESPQLAAAVAAGVLAVPGAEEPASAPTSVEVDQRVVHVVDGKLVPGIDGAGRRVGRVPPFPGEFVLAVATVDETGYAYVKTAGEPGSNGGRIAKFSTVDGGVEWQHALRPEMVEITGRAVLRANEDGVVVAGGEVIGMLDADDHALLWKLNVVTTGKSRSYALPGASHQLEITESFVYVSTSPAR